MIMKQNTFELFEKLHHPAIIEPSEPLHQKWLYIILAKTVVIAHTVQTKIVFFRLDFIAVDLGWSLQRYRAGRGESSSPMNKKYEL